MISGRHCFVSTSTITHPFVSSISAPAVRCDPLGFVFLGFHPRENASFNSDQLTGRRDSNSRQRNCCNWEFRPTTVGKGMWVRFLLLDRRQLSNNRTKRRRLYICAAASSPESFYDILGVPPTATESDIKRAYRKLALKYHPDVYKAPDAQQKFMSIKNAYQTLVDSKMRSKYDASKRSASRNDGFDWGFSTAKKQDQEDFYGIGEFLRDLQISLEDFFRDLQADIQKAAASGKPKSLWEELAEIGEEFVEFLEKELNLVDGMDQSVGEKENSYDFDSKEQKTSYNSTKKNFDTEPTTNKAEKDIEDIEDMLAKLKEELGI